jgi:hypothetical protein
MNRFLLITLLSVFLYSTVGVIASSVTCTVREKKLARCCSSQNDDCCKKEVKLLKLDHDFLSSAHQKVMKPLDAPVMVVMPEVKEVTFFSLPLSNNLISRPPPRPVDARLSFVQSYLI